MFPSILQWYQQIDSFAQQLAAHPFAREVFTWGQQVNLDSNGCSVSTFRPTAILTESGDYRAIFAGWNLLGANNTNTVFASPNESLFLLSKVADESKLLVIGDSAVSLQSITTTLPVYAALGDIVFTLPAVSAGSYVLADANLALFAWNSETRQITVNDASLLKRGMQQELQFQIKQDDVIVGYAIVTVAVTWPNRVPLVDTPAGPFSIFENSLPGTLVGQLAVSDPDGGTHSWQIFGGNAAGAFQIDNTGRITVAATAPLDFEVTPTFTLQVSVTDQVTWNPLSDTTIVTIGLQDIAIEIDTSSITSVVENSQTGTLIGTLTPKDWTGTGPLVYSIQSVTDGTGASKPASMFTIVPTGNLTAELRVQDITALDYEGLFPNNYVDLVFNVSDSAGADVGFAVTRLTIADGNDFPHVSLGAWFVSSLAENLSNAANIKVADIVIWDDALGTNVLGLTGPDADSFVIVSVGSLHDLQIKAEQF